PVLGRSAAEVATAEGRERIVERLPRHGLHLDGLLEREGTADCLPALGLGSASTRRDISLSRLRALVPDRFLSATQIVSNAPSVLPVVGGGRGARRRRRC